MRLPQRFECIDCHAVRPPWQRFRLTSQTTSDQAHAFPARCHMDVRETTQQRHRRCHWCQKTTTCRELHFQSLARPSFACRSGLPESWIGWMHRRHRQVPNPCRSLRYCTRIQCFLRGHLDHRRMLALRPKLLAFPRGLLRPREPLLPHDRRCCSPVRCWRHCGKASGVDRVGCSRSCAHLEAWSAFDPQANFQGFLLSIASMRPSRHSYHSKSDCCPWQTKEYLTADAEQAYCSPKQCGDHRGLAIAPPC